VVRVVLGLSRGLDGAPHHWLGARRMTGRVLCAALLAVCACLMLGVVDASAIVGGEPAPPGRWPWMAALIEPSDDAFYGQFCGATVIGRRRLLTAGHCVLGERATGMTVLVGRSRLTERGGRQLPVTGISVFRAYQGMAPGLDAAVVTVGSDIGLPAVALASAADEAALADGATAWTMGWGRLNGRRTPGGSFYTADRLRQLREPIVGDDACERVYGAGSNSLSYRPAWELCAGSGDATTGTCYGDSGGPLVVESPAGWTQVGIIQSGDGCASPGFFDLYTRVDRVRAFATADPLTIQPESLSPTRIRGRFAVGRVLTCVRGRFIGSPARYDAAWLWVTPSGEPTRIVGRSWRHTVTRMDRRHRLTCTVFAHNDGGTFAEQAQPLVP
jgi:secreted trypsin-like serine protease